MSIRSDSNTILPVVDQAGIWSDYGIISPVNSKTFIKKTKQKGLNPNCWIKIKLLLEYVVELHYPSTVFVLRSG